MGDFYSDAARKQFELLEAQRAASLADLASHRANGDTESAAQTVQQLANLESEKQNLQALYQSYVLSQQPPAPTYQTPEELQVKSLDKMTPDDALQLAKTSKYGKGLDWNDPHVRAGYVEAQRRRSRGE